MTEQPITYDRDHVQQSWQRYRLAVTGQDDPVVLTGIAQLTADGDPLGARLYDEHEHYVGMISHVCHHDPANFDPADPQRTVQHYVSQIDRILREHASFDAALHFTAQHAGLLLPGLHALEAAIIRAPQSERAYLRAAIDGLTSRNETCRDRWAAHAQALSVRSRLYPEPKSA